MQILKADWRGKGKWGVVAKALNAIGKLFNDIHGENGIDVEYRGGRLVISAETAPGGGRFPWPLFAFGWALEADEETGMPLCRIYPGAVRMHGVGTFRSEGGTVDLDPMTAPWVYLVMPRSGGSIDIQSASTEPESNTTTLKIPLYQFERTDGGSYVIPEGGIRNLGDINLDTPLL